MIDIRQSHQYAKYLKNIGWKVEKINETNYFIRKIPLIGSILKIQRPEEIKYKQIKKLKRKHRVLKTIIEPKTEIDAKYLTSVGFKLSKSPYLPTKTIQIDLTSPKENIYLKFKKDCRRAINKNKDLRFRTYDSGNINDFRNIWKKSVGFSRYIPPLTHLTALKKSFGKNALFITDKEGGLPDEASAKSGAIFLATDKIAYYWQAFNSKNGREKQIQYQIVWEGILWAKRLSIKIFDFEGIFDERFPNHTWLGFTHFKRSFNGYEVKYPGTFTK